MSSQQPASRPLLRWLVLSLFAAIVTAQQVSAEFSPTVSSSSASSIAATSATLGGDITFLGDSLVTARGVVYSVTSLNANPTLGGTDVVMAPAPGDANALGVFAFTVSGLQSATAYSFTAFATNSSGTSYGDVLTFTTPGTPVITSATSTSIGSTTATLGGNVTSDGGGSITERGVVVSPTTSNSNPLIGGGNVTKVTTMGTTGVFTILIEDLNPGTEYSFKAYASNSEGVSYTSVATFTTITVPSLASTPTSGSITSTAATLGGNVTSDGLATITERGVVYSITASDSSPRIGDSAVTKVTTTGTTGVFTIAVTGLANGTAYTFAAYAINSEGTTYSNFGNFDTDPVTPVITTPTQASIATDVGTAISSATLGGNVTLPGSQFIERGVVYSITANDSDPYIGESAADTEVSANTAGTTGVFTVDLENLLPYTSYTFKAYVKNNAGTVSYTSIDTFTTPAVAPLVNGGSTVALVTSSSATLGGNVFKTGGRTLTECGVIYSITGTNNNPLLNGSGVTKRNTTASTGVFTVAITGLAAGTQYSFKVFAKSAAGTSYSSVATFTTSTTAPTITAPTKSSITSTAATLGGNVTNNGSLTISERGVVYSLTSQNSNPRVNGANVTKKTASGSTGVFIVPVTGLVQGKQYSFAAYAKNSAGTSYTTVGTFTTLASAPTVTTPGIDSISSTKATFGGNVTKDGGSEITERGVVYSLTSQNGNPQLNGANVIKQTATGTTGVFAVKVTGLTPAKKYSFAAYAINSVGTTYSSIASFTTSSETPTITTPTMAMITSSKATLGGNVTKDGGSVINERGVVYSIKAKNKNPLVGGSGVKKKTTTGNTGVFEVLVVDLQPDTEYTFKAYATNSAGTEYTAVGSFTTSAAPPTVAKPRAVEIGSSIARLRGNVKKDNGAKIIECGVVYSLTSTNKKPRLAGKGVRKVTTTPATGAFTVLISRLKPGSKYSFAAYAKNSKGIRYSQVASFTTLPEAPKVKSSPTKDAIDAESAILGGNVVKDNGARITKRGVVYSTTDDNPQFGAPGVSAKIVEGSTGSFSIRVKDLTPETRYFFRAYAKNKMGTSYSEVSSFTTLEPVDATPTN